MSLQGVSRNGPWERLTWTQRTLGRVSEKNETPRRFSSISVLRTPISGFGLWTVPVALVWGKIMSHKHKNLSYLFLLLATFKKFIDNISGFFGMKPSSENPALLQSCKFTSMKENAGKCHFFRKNVGPFHRNCVDRGFCLSGRAGELFLPWKTKLFFFFPSSFA